MAQPKVCDWAKIERIARYFVNASQAVQKFASQEKTTHITTYVDSNWAGGKITTKPSSASAMYLSMHLLKVMELNSTGHGAVEQRGRAPRHAQRNSPERPRASLSPRQWSPPIVFSAFLLESYSSSLADERQLTAPDEVDELPHFLPGFRPDSASPFVMYTMTSNTVEPQSRQLCTPVETRAPTHVRRYVCAA